MSAARYAMALNHEQTRQQIIGKLIVSGEIFE